MKKFSALCFVLLLSLFFASGCFLKEEVVSEASVVPTAIPGPFDPGFSGFVYYEDPTKEAGFDPVFAICDGKVLKFSQNGTAWTISPLLMSEFEVYKGALQAVGQTSDYDFYSYDPTVGLITVKTSQGDVYIKQSAKEYNPEHWFWAWTSLIFIKDCHLHIYDIHKDISEKVSKAVCHIDFVDYYADCDPGFVFEH